jgi:NAD(P)-dependent dehydrogenase (short-subunit alcohol dehydrogenase family)
MTSTQKIAVVTGAASGIGRATAFHLAHEGYEVAMMDLDISGLEGVRGQIEAAGGKAHSFPVNLTDPLAVGSVAREIAVRVGTPHALVNVAGIGVAATVLETSDEDWNRVLSVNLTGPFLTTRATLPLMLDRGSGVIINGAALIIDGGMTAI